MSSPAIPDIELPRQYRDALQLSETMLHAAALGDWDEVKRLRRHLPRLAHDLQQSWEALESTCPEARRQLESARIRLIRQILRVDEQIRRLSSPGYARLSPWLRTVPVRRAIVKPSLSSVSLS
ncbi:MAG: flagellar protein FliT [Lautropia sp.]|nr:flagellar protein FliT [Lautropia sp.]